VLLTGAEELNGPFHKLLEPCGSSEAIKQNPDLHISPVRLFLF